MQFKGKVKKPSITNQYWQLFNVQRNSCFGSVYFTFHFIYCVKIGCVELISAGTYYSDIREVKVSDRMNHPDGLGFFP
jgi:hypothetical protein